MADNLKLSVGFIVLESHKALIDGKQITVADKVEPTSVGLIPDDKIPPCKYNYHDDDHEDLCVFECTLDGLLEPNSQLTEKAQEYRDQLIVGVERMMDKVTYYRRMYE